MILWNAEGLKPIGYLVWPLRSLKVRNHMDSLLELSGIYLHSNIKIIHTSLQTHSQSHIFIEQKNTCMTQHNKCHTTVWQANNLSLGLKMQGSGIFNGKERKNRRYGTMEWWLTSVGSRGNRLVHSRLLADGAQCQVNKVRPGGEKKGWDNSQHYQFTSSVKPVQCHQT